jgi:hypothetical protein
MLHYFYMNYMNDFHIYTTSRKCCTNIVLKIVHCLGYTVYDIGARGGVVGLGTMLKA